MSQMKSRRYKVVTVQQMHQSKKLEQSIENLERKYVRVSKVIDEQPRLSKNPWPPLEALHFERKNIQQEFRINGMEIERESKNKPFFQCSKLALPQRLLFKLKKLFWHNKQVTLGEIV
ncbi:hypothetical protein GWI33_013298 [Rhynchophorus ferrugineus]|uniref:Uncharacterized protein n=1 Tax=Rhynchophorus ferrugineus TaxID=354439 RepID=A0A834M6R5_RHYFE|nr:hypothetical protein GWI33_013298 [Rhynchophorus ferrugineus]